MLGTYICSALFKVAAAVAAVLCLFVFSSSAQAQTAVNCPTYDTTIFTNGSTVVLSECTINMGPLSTLFVTATGEVSCGSTDTATLFITSGLSTSPPYGSNGANFNGAISGGVLTITNMVTPAAFKVAAGQTLFDSQSGAGIPTSATGSTLTITGPISGSGGIGTYSVSDASVSVSNELLWALNVAPPISPPPGFGSPSGFVLEELYCRNGTTEIVTLAGGISAGAFIGTNLVFWVGIAISSEFPNPKIASWKNGQISFFVPGTPGARGPFGMVQ